MLCVLVILEQVNYSTVNNSNYFINLFIYLKASGKGIDSQSIVCFSCIDKTKI